MLSILIREEAFIAVISLCILSHVSSVLLDVTCYISTKINCGGGLFLLARSQRLGHQTGVE
jgi:hypothetical protein